ncbi:MAG TPA: archease [Pirellulales bacterium]|jgi:SHS2 domain-containing protein|nr:archease [Pirellulales bacterium]
MYETFEHTADLGLRVRAADLPSLFADAGRGLFSIIVAGGVQVQPQEEWRCELSGSRLDELLFDWLNELLYVFESRHLLLAEFHVVLAGEQLTAQCRGEPWDPARHQLEHEVKAITYHGLRVEQTADGWLAEVIVDI